MGIPQALFLHHLGLFLRPLGLFLRARREWGPFLGCAVLHLQTHFLHA
jgi:hypothetical protein